MTKKTKAISTILTGILVLALVYFCIIIPVRFMQEPKILLTEASLLKNPVAVPTFKFVTDEGTPFTQSNLQGHWTLMFFGLINCTQDCPATLATLQEVYKQLQNNLPKERLPQIVMVATGPDQTNLPKLHAYMKSFDPDFIGIQANMKQTVALEKALHNLDTKFPAIKGSNTQNQPPHDPELVIIDPTGHVRGYFNYLQKPEHIVNDYLRIVAGVKT